MCKLEIEDEAHVLFFCRAYSKLRRDAPVLHGVLPESADSVENILSDDSEDTIRQVSRFLYRAFCVRESQ